MQQQKNRVEVQGNNKHSVLFQTKVNYSPEPRLCCFVAAQFETGLLTDITLKNIQQIFTLFPNYSIPRFMPQI